MKKGLWLVSFAALLTCGMVACGPAGNVPVVTYTVEIKNKTALQNEWHVGDANRTCTVVIPGVVVDDHWGDDLFLTSNNTNVVKIQGDCTLVATGAGEARITATFKGSYTDYVDLTILPKPALKVVMEPQLNTPYKLSEFSVSGRRYALDSMQAKYYIGTEDTYDEGVNSMIVNASAPDGDYKYAIKIGEKTLGYYIADGHTNIGFVGEKSYDGKHDYTETAFKFNQDDYTFCAKLSDNNVYWIGTYDANTTISYRKADQIVYKAQFVEMGEPTPITSISLNKQTLSLEVADTETLIVNTTPVGLITDGTVWSSSNTDVATVSTIGTITAIKAGTTTITATLEGKTAQCAVTVTGQAINHGTREHPLTIDEAKAVLDKYGNKVISAQKMWVTGVVSSSAAEDSYGGRNIWLKNGDTQQAFELYGCHIDDSIKGIPTTENALVGYTVVAEGWGELFNGTYEFTNKDASGQYDYCFVRDLTAPEPDPLEDLALSANVNEIVVGQELNVTAAPVPSTAKLPTDLVWEVDGTYLEKVSDGVVKGKAVGPGWVKISSASAGKEKTLNITVKEGTDTRWENNTEETLTEINALPYPADNSKSTEEYAIIGTLGEITKSDYGNASITDKAGTTTITVYGMYDSLGKTRYDALTANKPIKDDVVILKGIIQAYKDSKTGNITNEIVNAKIMQINGTKAVPPQLTGIKLNQESATIKLNDTASFTATPIPVDADLGTVTWAITEGESNISLDKTTGNTVVVTGLVAGNAKVTATSGSIVKEISITVENSQITSVEIPMTGFGGSSATAYVTDQELEGTFGGIKYNSKNLNPSNGQIRGNKTTIGENWYLYNTAELKGTLTKITVSIPVHVTNTFKNKLYVVYSTTASVGGVTDISSCDKIVGTLSADNSTFTFDFSGVDGVKFIKICTNEKFTNNNCTKAVVKLEF